MHVIYESSYTMTFSGQARQRGAGEVGARGPGDEEGEREPPDRHRDPQAAEQEPPDREGHGGRGLEHSGLYNIALIKQISKYNI